MLYGVRILALSWLSAIVVLPSWAIAGPQLVPTDDRPDVLIIDSKKTPKSVEFPDFVIRLQFQFIAEMLEFYPNDELYFLGRDSEYLYDIARLVTEGTERAAHIHLLNISKTSAEARHFTEYLKNQGLPSFFGGARARIVDTGLSGTIYKTIVGWFFREENPDEIRSHLITSSDIYPQTRGALLKQSKARRSKPSWFSRSRVSPDRCRIC